MTDRRKESRWQGMVHTKRGASLAARLKAIRDNPDAARALMSGKRPKDYPGRSDMDGHGKQK